MYEQYFDENGDLKMFPTAMFDGDRLSSHAWYWLLDHLDVYTSDSDAVGMYWMQELFNSKATNLAKYVRQNCD